MLTSGELHLLDTDFPCEKVGASSLAEALAALFLETAYNYQKAKSLGEGDGERFLKYVNATDGISMMIVVGKKTAHSESWETGVLEEFKKLETITSFVDFLKRLDSEAPDYWHLVFSRVKLQLPKVDIALDLNSAESHTIRDSFFRLILTLVGYGIFCLGAAVIQIGAIVLAYNLIKPVADTLGDALLVKVGAIIVGFVVMIVAEAAVIWPFVWSWCTIDDRWPNNPVRRLIDWVKESPPDSLTCRNDW
jgi:hypothetical protein